MDVENPTPHFFPTPSTHFQILLCHSGIMALLHVVALKFSLSLLKATTLLLLTKAIII